MNTLAIKNLSIALEAISRINHPSSGNLFEAIEQLLDVEISKQRKANNESYRKAQQADDDIPF